MIVLIAVPAAEAPAVARRRPEDGRAAGVNLPPGVRSTYAWGGRVAKSDEALLPVKTTGAGCPARGRRAREPHPYAVPQILALPVAAGLDPYLDWLKRSVTPA
ncbi:MAG TPA: divalent cation tolerance protein CutA [Steroidobacteraceae bacterium]|nr:divalent cation tolerance protein CutA [Steroidobacteraceae bacterium]